MTKRANPMSAVRHRRGARRHGADVTEGERGRRDQHRLRHPRANGVRLPAYLLAQYPEEMTIILQFQFRRLVVRDDRFEVGLWFEGRPERLVIPFDAVKAFHDRSVATCFGRNAKGR
jgi:hypothetical protein